jgi:TolA-binding protein
LNALIIIPVWAAILGAVGIAAMVGFPSALLGARYGAKLAVELCAKQQGCAMRVNQERQQTTQNLEEQLAALHKKHPELAKAREAMNRVLKDTGENVAIPEKPKR